MRQFTKDQRIKNLLVAIDMVEQLPAKAFVKHLLCWRDNDKWITLRVNEPPCGTQACFGGWIAQHPYFKKLGVKTIGENSEPSIAKPDADPMDVAELLFGDRNLFRSTFDGRRFYPSDCERMSDKKKILARLKQTLEEQLEDA